MSKLLLLLLAVLAAVWLTAGFRRKRAAKEAPQAAAEQMVVCGHCGVHLPQGEAIVQAEKYYCCDEHRRLAG